MKTKAFTIIEVLISVIILSTVATILFNISIQSKKNYIFYKKKIFFENLSTLALFRDNLSNTNIFENIRKEYIIKDDKIRKELKKIKLYKKTREISTIKLDEDISFKIFQIHIFSNNSSSNYTKIGLK